MDAPALLQAIRMNVAEVAARPRPVGYGYAREKQEIEHACTGRVRVDFVRWCGRLLTSAEHRAVVRLLHRLADAGQIELIIGPTGRTIAVCILTRSSTTIPARDGGGRARRTPPRSGRKRRAGHDTRGRVSPTQTGTVKEAS
jgi:hypothetical protein